MIYFSIEHLFVICTHVIWNSLKYWSQDLHRTNRKVPIIFYIYKTQFYIYVIDPFWILQFRFLHRQNSKKSIFRHNLFESWISVYWLFVVFKLIVSHKIFFYILLSLAEKQSHKRNFSLPIKQVVTTLNMRQFIHYHIILFYNV